MIGRAGASEDQPSIADGETSTDVGKTALTGAEVRDLSDTKLRGLADLERGVRDNA